MFLATASVAVDKKVISVDKETARIVLQTTAAAAGSERISRRSALT